MDVPVILGFLREIGIKITVAPGGKKLPEKVRYQTYNTLFPV